MAYICQWYHRMGFTWVPLFGGKTKSRFCFTVYQVKMWKKRTANHLYKLLSTCKSAPRFSRQKKSLASLDAPYVALLLQCCLHLQTVSHSNGCSSLRIRPQTGEQGGYCTTSRLHHQRTFLTVVCSIITWRHFQPVPDTSPQMHNVDGTVEMTCKMINNFVGG
jgi:hypothetical protein